MTKPYYEYAFKTALGEYRLFLSVWEDRWVWRIFEQSKDYRFFSLEQVFEDSSSSSPLVISSRESDSYQYEVQVVKFLDEMQSVLDELGIPWVRLDGRRLVAFLAQKNLFILLQFLSRSLLPSPSFECRFLKTVTIPSDDPDIRESSAKLLDIFFQETSRASRAVSNNGISLREVLGAIWRNITRIFRL